MLNSRDIFAANEAEQSPSIKSSDINCNRGQINNLFSFGRTLWAAILNHMPVKSDHDLRRAERIRYGLQLPPDKTRWSKAEEHKRHLALLSYRIDSYIHRHECAEQLVSGWMRYITWVDDNREMMYTVQPSVPILAHTAARYMQDAQLRHGINEEFQRKCSEAPSVQVGTPERSLPDCTLPSLWTPSNSSTTRDNGHDQRPREHC